MDNIFVDGNSTENSRLPVGVAQMDSWVSMNDGGVHIQLRINLACEYSVEETCPHCSAPVRFELTDAAICRERYMSRCRAPMRLCSVLQPLRHCVCCGDVVDKLLPESSMEASPLDFNQDVTFCRTLLQRSMPLFLFPASVTLVR